MLVHRAYLFDVACKFVYWHVEMFNTQNTGDFHSGLSSDFSFHYHFTLEVKFTFVPISTVW